MDTDKKGLAGKIIRSLALSVLGLFFSGCGENCKFQVGSGLPAERPAYGIMQEEYDRKMEQLKGEYQGEMRIQRIITPQNDSVNGYLPLGRAQF